MWLGHLQGIAQFTKEVVEKLAIFGTNGSPEMMGEVLKAAASRMKICGKTAARIKVSVQGWGNPVTMDLPGENLEEVMSVAQAVGAKFSVEEVEYFRSLEGPARESRKILQMVLNHMEDQEEMLAFTELHRVPLTLSQSDNVTPAEELFFALLKVSKRWKIGKLGILFEDPLARFPMDLLAAGHIEQMCIGKWVMRLGNLDDLRRIWEITAKVTVYGTHGRPDTTLGGGKGENTDENWQRLLDIRLNDEEDDEEDV